MPTVNLQNVSGEPLFLGRPDGRRVEDGEIVHVEGTLSKDSPEDAFLIGDGDEGHLEADQRQEQGRP